MSEVTELDVFRDRMEQRKVEHYLHFFEPVTSRFLDGLAELIDEGHGRPAVDLGCGDGRLAQRLIDRGWNAVAMDRARHMVRRARSRLGQHRVAIADAVHLPVATGSVHALTAAFLVPHLDDLDTAFGEMRRVLRPGGLLGLSTWDTPGRSPFTGIAVELIRAHAQPGHDQIFADLAGRASVDHLRGRLVDAGFEVAEFSRVNVEVDVGSPEMWWNGLVRGSMGLSYLLEHCTPPARNTVRSAFLAHAAGGTVNGRTITSAQAVLLSAARR